MLYKALLSSQEIEVSETNVTECDKNSTDQPLHEKLGLLQPMS